MELYQALTQVTLNAKLAGKSTMLKKTMETAKPLHNDLGTLYQYIDSVLKPGANHKENNLSYVTDHIFILHHFDFEQHQFTQAFKTPDQQAHFAYNLVEDLNRHLTVNFKPEQKELQFVFADY